MLYSYRYAGQEAWLHNFTQQTSTRGNCYTFNSGENKSILSSTSSGRIFGLELVFNTEEYEYFQAESDSVEFNVFIHDPDHFPYYVLLSIGWSTNTSRPTQS